MAVVYTPLGGIPFQDVRLVESMYLYLLGCQVGVAEGGSVLFVVFVWRLSITN